MNPADLLTRGLDTKTDVQRQETAMVSRTPMSERFRRHMASTNPGTSIHAEYESPQFAVTTIADIEENPNILNIINLAAKYTELSNT